MLTFLMQSMLGNAGMVCFDLEAWDWGWGWGDDEVHEDTTCKLCATVYNEGRHIAHNCIDGAKNEKNKHSCIYLGREHIAWKHNVMIETTCDDEMWVDRFLVYDHSSKVATNQLIHTKTYGWNNADGWCMSTDVNDYKQWNNEWWRAQRVSDNTCHRALTLDATSYDVWKVSIEDAPRRQELPFGVDPTSATGKRTRRLGRDKGLADRLPTVLRLPGAGDAEDSSYPEVLDIPVGAGDAEDSKYPEVLDIPEQTDELEIDA